MKRMLSFALALVLAIGASPAAYGATTREMPDTAIETFGPEAPAKPASANTMTRTTANSGAPTSAVGATLNIGDTFDVVFARSALNWSGSGSTYSFAGFLDSWVKVNSAAVEINSITKNGETGTVVVRLKAKTAFSGTVSVWLDSAPAGAASVATTAFSKQLTIEDPAVKAAEAKAAAEAIAAANAKAAAEAQAAADARAAEVQAAADKAAADKAAADQAAADKAAADKAAADKAAADKAAADKAAADKAAADKAAADKAAADKAAADKIAANARTAEIQAAADQSAADQAAADKAASEKAASEKAASEKAANDQAAADQAAADKAASEKAANDQAAADQAAAIQAAADQAAADKAIADKILADAKAAEEAQAAADKALADKLAAEKAAADAVIPAPTTATITGIAKDGGAPVASTSGPFNEKQTFAVTFDAAAFTWSAEKPDLYDMSQFDNAWVKTTISSDVAKVVGIVTHNSTGRVDVILEATTPGTGAVSVWLENATASSKAFSTPLTVVATPSVHPSTIKGLKATTDAPIVKVPATIPVGTSFDVVFPSTMFDWSVGNNTYSIAGFDKSWVKIGGTARAAIPVELKGTPTLDNAGNMTVTLVATAQYSGTLSVSMRIANMESYAADVPLTVTQEQSKIAKTVNTGTQPTASHTSTATVEVGGKLTYTFLANSFAWNPENGIKTGATLPDLSWIQMTGASRSDFALSAEAANANGDVTVVLTPIRSGNYKNLQVYLQGGGTAAAPSVATIPSTAINLTVPTINSGKITGIANGAYLGGTGSGAFLNGKTLSYSDLANLEVKADDELLLPLRAGFFTWSGTAPYPTTAVTKNQLNAGKIKVAVSNRSGSNVFANVKPELYSSGGQMYVRVKFAKNLATTKDIDFTMNIYLTVDGRRDQDSALELYGTMVREVYTVYDRDSYVDISDGGVVEADIYLRNVELYLGSHVTAFSNLSRGRKYAGTATMDLTSADESILSKYREIEEIITVTTSGLTASNTKIKIDVGGYYYVYNQKFEYLGRTSEMLPLSSKYYLSTKKIDRDEVEEVDGGGETEYEYDDVSKKPTTPAPAPAPNRNNNAKTGR